MPKFRVKIVFTRKSYQTNKIEKSERIGEFFAPDKETAEKGYLKQFHYNEPNLKKIQSIKVTRLTEK